MSMVNRSKRMLEMSEEMIVCSFHRFPPSFSIQLDLLLSDNGDQSPRRSSRWWSWLKLWIAGLLVLFPGSPSCSFLCLVHDDGGGVAVQADD